MTADLLRQVCWCEGRERLATPAQVWAGEGWSCHPRCQPGCEPYAGLTPTERAAMRRPPRQKRPPKRHPRTFETTQGRTAPETETTQHDPPPLRLGPRKPLHPPQLPPTRHHGTYLLIPTEDKPA